MKNVQLTRQMYPELLLSQPKLNYNITAISTALEFDMKWHLACFKGVSRVSRVSEDFWGTVYGWFIGVVRVFEFCF